MRPDLHPSQEALLKFFDYSNEPEKINRIAAEFFELAHRLVSLVGTHLKPDAEFTTCLRKLLEARDCALRAVEHQDSVPDD